MEDMSDIIGAIIAFFFLFMIGYMARKIREGIYIKKELKKKIDEVSEDSETSVNQEKVKEVKSKYRWRIYGSGSVLVVIFVLAFILSGFLPALAVTLVPGGMGYFGFYVIPIPGLGE